MKEMQSVLYYLMINVRRTFIIFWIILTSIYAVSIIFSFIVGNGHVFFQAYFPVYIFSMVIGMWTVKNALPYLLKMGMTRKMMYGSIWLYFFLFAMINVLLAHLYSFITDLLNRTQTGGKFTIVNGVEEYVFDFTHIAQFLENDTLWNRISVDIILCMTVLIFMFMMGLIFYQYGLIGGFSFVGLFLIAYFILLATDGLIDVFSYIYHHFTMVLFYQLLGITLIVYLLTYLILRRFTLK